MSELRDTIKQWEHAFLEEHGHKPTASDVRSDPAIRNMYKRYHTAKRNQSQASEVPLTPQKRKVPVPRKGEIEPPTSAADLEGVESETDDDSVATPHKPTEIFPTPQFHGRVLGLFDVELSSPETPSKNRSDTTALTVNTPQTPSGRQLIVAETPMSKRTPDYLLNRSSLFRPVDSPTKGNSVDNDSPLVKRKPLRSKSVTELMREAAELQSLQFEGEDTALLAPVSEVEKEASSAIDGEPAKSTGAATPGAPPVGRVRKGPKRQTKRVIMRPINDKDVPSMAKPTENYKRLKINNNRGKRPFRRR